MVISRQPKSSAHVDPLFSNLGIACISLMFVIPLLWPAIPPLSDLPGHMGQYRIMLAHGISPALARVYNFHWTLIGDLGADGLMLPLGSILGVEPATKLITMCIPLLTAAGMLILAREVHGRVPPTAFFALPLAYSYPFQFGFVNFTLAMALALWAAAFWLRLGTTGRLKLRAVIFVPIAMLLWICHVAGWGLFGLFAFGCEIASGRRRHRSWERSAVDAMIAVIPLSLPILVMLAHRDGISAGTGHWSVLRKLGWLISLERDRWIAFDIGSALLTYAFLISCFFSRKIRLEPVLALPAALYLAAFVIVPGDILGGSYADMRILPFSVALALLSVDPGGLTPNRQSQLLAAGSLFAITRLSFQTVSYIEFDTALASELGAVSQIAYGASVLVLNDRACVRPWTLSRFEHLGSMAIVRRDAFSNDQWAIEGSHLIRIRKLDAAPFAADPSQYVNDKPCLNSVQPTLDDAVAHFNRRSFDYLWTVGFPPGRISDLGLRQTWTNGKSTLYAVARPHDDANGSDRRRENAGIAAYARPPGEKREE